MRPFSSFCAALASIVVHLVPCLNVRAPCEQQSPGPATGLAAQVSSIVQDSAAHALGAHP